MSDMHPHSTAKVGGHPLHPMIVPFPIVLFISALVTDVIYLNSHRPGFAEASVWLIGAGLAMGALAAVLGFIDVIGDARLRSLTHVWWHMGANVAAVVLELVSLYLRASQGPETALAPAGVAISAVVTAILLFSGWMGGELVYRDHVGAIDGQGERVRAP